ncbi:hypothetical protein KSD_33890 [Ktedonobacter sp. SOSP1-85]|uniref:PIG-L family deacetylase n=1 Tax=Ktedonobacter sp. SOSP1-85 TaxID=2778367 RepID=UPI0019164C74|nr:PIG-L family deacetylase [Ktedonobacter sp. SOSP1-85]GHO75618.1 hypothetical protein KSD_33890 [Ktedonobacter sp. SOSP1-85]
MSTKRLLGVFAHPDDEGFISGALLHYRASGIETGLVFATRGEVGEISDPLLKTRDDLDEIREEEMRMAASLLGVNNLWFLGYRDSGVRGAPDNQHARAFIHARPAEVVGKLVQIIRQFRPQVIVTFDETGADGHPDHLAIYRYTTSAFHAAADSALYPDLGPAHSAAKLYYTGMTRQQILTMTEWLQEQEPGGPFKNADPQTLGLTDEQINIVLDVERWQDDKVLAASQHRTQVNPSNPVAQMLPEFQRKLRATEYYQLATSRVGDDTMGENDLFTHVEG